MSINDLTRIVYSPRRQKYRLERGRETFYTDQNIMIEFDSEQQAEQYAKDHGLRLEEPEAEQTN